MQRLPFSYVQINMLLFIIPSLLLAYGYYLEHKQGLEPCPLCMTQRIAFYCIAICAFSALFNRNSRIYKNISAGFGALFCLVGLGVASRQLWLQHLPEDQVPACGPSFDYIVDTFPVIEAIAIMFRGNGNCAEVVWTFLGLSIPGWAFLAFLGLLLGNILQLLRHAVRS